MQRGARLASSERALLTRRCSELEVPADDLEVPVDEVSSESVFNLKAEELQALGSKIVTVIGFFSQ